MPTGSPRRTLWVIAYGLMACAGGFALAFPTPAVRAATTATSGALVYVWAALLVVGGLSSAVGSALDRWLGEYAGNLALAATFGVYALAAAASGRLTAIAGACALGAVAMLLCARWRDVAFIRREAARFRAEHREG